MSLVTPSDGPVDALVDLHEERWDDERGMDRYAPGVAPGVDLEALGLHSVRETALGAYLDLEWSRRPSQRRRQDRAIRALTNVLALQYPTSDRPWSDTFPTSAEQPAPPGDDAIEWVHYDPNWRQFLGCILALVDIDHGDLLPDSLRAGIRAAIARAARGEPADRIAPWYTNPNLMQAWLQAHVGVIEGDDTDLAAGISRAQRCVERWERFGDVDEYNSPTYDGIDLFALALWVEHPPTTAFRTWGDTVLAGLAERIAEVYHPGLAAICPPFHRAYGLGLRRYVSLAGLWLHLVGERADSVLPPSIDRFTDHVHDLYFLAVFRPLVDAVERHLRPVAVVATRTHEQRFERSTATSVVRDDLAVGWEHGRREGDSIDQYVPFGIHTADGASIGVMVPEETAWIDVDRDSDPERADTKSGLRLRLRAGGRDGRVGVRLVAEGTARPEQTGPRELVVGRLTARFDTTPEHVDVVERLGRWEAHATWTADRLEGELSVADVPATPARGAP